MATTTKPASEQEDFGSQALVADEVVVDTVRSDSLVLDGLTFDAETQGITATARTATADGLTTGLIPAGTKFVSATSANADHIITLPSGAAGNVGTVIRGWVGATGLEIRTPAASGATINGQDSDGTKEAAIPATTLFELTLVATDTWVLRAWDELGAVITAIVPD